MSALRTVDGWTFKVERVGRRYIARFTKKGKGGGSIKITMRVSAASTRIVQRTIAADIAAMTLNDVSTILLERAEVMTTFRDPAGAGERKESA